MGRKPRSSSREVRIRKPFLVSAVYFGRGTESPNQKRGEKGHQLLGLGVTQPIRHPFWGRDPIFCRPAPRNPMDVWGATPGPSCTWAARRRPSRRCRCPSSGLGARGSSHKTGEKARLPSLKLQATWGSAHLLRTYSPCYPPKS